MKRLGAWIVMIFMQVLVYFGTSLVMGLAVALLNAIYGLSKLAYYIVLFIGGGGLLSVAGGIAMFGAGLTVSASNGVCESKDGKRFKYFGGICIAQFALSALILLIGLLGGRGTSSTFSSLIMCGLMIFENITMIAAAK